ncbi:hypothetical protein ABMA27_002576 [Loxostege sticticalis]|uniref:Uncharacterized protein n=1 Tax=Loxostege sticticalis TaxID=481309 RepID=A0ABR3HUB4_LOXSC
MTVYWITFLTQVLLVSAASVGKPKCEKTDSQCLKSTAQETVPALVAGIPDIGAAALDPIILDKVKIDLAGLKLLITNAAVKGLKKSVIEKINVDRTKKVLELKYVADIVLKSKYKASGRLLILPISGDGDLTLKLKKIQVDVSMPFEYSKNTDGQTILDLKSFSFKYDVKENAHFHLTNLFNGNKELSDAMLTFMNNNWKVLTEEFGAPLLQASHKVIFDSIKKYMATQLIEE